MYPIIVPFSSSDDDIDPVCVTITEELRICISLDSLLVGLSKSCW